MELIVGPRRWLTWALWALALAGLLYLVGLTIWLGLSGLFFPYQLDYGEGVNLFYTKQLALGQPIYRPIGQYPYITSNYAPLPFLLALALTPILGFTYAAGRIWTLVAVVALATLIIAWVRRETGRWLPAVVAALLFVGAPYIYHWAPLFRVDLIGLALTLGGLYAVYCYAPRPRSPAEGRKSWLLWLAVVLFVAALYAKQSYFFAPAAALAYLFFFVDRRQAILAAAGIGLLGGGLFLAINARTGGSFWQSMVVANVNPFLWPEFWQQQADFFGTFAVLVLLAAWYLFTKFVRQRAVPLRDKVGLLDLYLPAALFSVLLAGKAGAWENYFFEALLALALCGGLGLARMAPLPWGRGWGRGKSSPGAQPAPHPNPLPTGEREPSPLSPRGRGAGGEGRISSLLPPLLLLAQAALLWHTPGVARDYLDLTRRSYEAMAPILAVTPDPIFAEDMGLLVAYDKTLDYHSFEYSQLAEAGRWDQAWELDQLRGRRRSLVILEKGTRLDVDRYRRYTRAFLSELDRSYRRARSVGKYELYEPDPLQHERRAAFGDQVALAGWSLEPAQPALPGDTVRLTVVWQAQQALATDYSAFAHLVDGAGQGWAGDDHQPYGGLYPTSLWGAGEMVRDGFTLTIPADAPPDLYTVEIGWYNPKTQDRLPAREGNIVRVAVLPVGYDPTGDQAMTPVDARFEGITLEGYTLEIGAENVVATLRWWTDDFLDTDYTVFLHLVGAGGGVALAQADGPPLAGRWPTSLWLSGVALDDEHVVPLPEGLPPGRYSLLVGLYDPQTNARLLLPDGRDALRLAEIVLP